MSRLLSEEELVETAEMLFNFRDGMSIQGIKEVLWQQAKAQDKQTTQDIFNKIEKLYNEASYKWSFEKLMMSKEWRDIKEGK